METRKTILISCKKNISIQRIFNLFQIILKYKEPTQFKAKHYANKKYYKFNEKKYVEAFNKEMNVSDDDIRFHLDWNGGSGSVICYKEDIAFRIHLELDEQDVALYNEVEKFIIENAIMAGESNSHDLNIQNQRFIHMLEWLGEDASSYPKCKGLLEDVEIDIAKNPGYMVNARGFDFAAFYRMWYGKAAYEMFDKDSLRSFACYENIVLDNDVTRITLYDNIFDYKKQENRNKQLEFRAYVHLDEIVNRVKQEELVERQKNLDPEINIKQGIFEHGGVRLIQTFLKDGENVRRSLADSVEEVEMDENGKEIFRAIKEL